jgi:hypothetical protein
MRPKHDAGSSQPNPANSAETFGKLREFPSYCIGTELNDIEVPLRKFNTTSAEARFALCDRATRTAARMSRCPRYAMMFDEGFVALINTLFGVQNQD